MRIPSIGSTQLVASPRLRAHAPQSEGLMRFQASRPVSAGERPPHFITSPLSGRVLECWNIVRGWRTVPCASARSVTFNRGIWYTVVAFKILLVRGFFSPILVGHWLTNLSGFWPPTMWGVRVV